ncbi:MAG: hypothetical protein F6J98_37325 [Moorea sp. SIO4G2]|nr:hypothetical protein [Moorena sp. SIO4G2]
MTGFFLSKLKRYAHATRTAIGRRPSYTEQLLNQDLRGEVYFAPLAPQFWGVMMSKSPRIGGFRGQMRKSYE